MNDFKEDNMSSEETAVLLLRRLFVILFWACWCIAMGVGAYFAVKDLMSWLDIVHRVGGALWKR